MIWYIPEVYNNIGFEVPVISDPDLIQNYCEYNCDSYISRFGGEKIEGAYVLKHHDLDLYQLVRHFVVYDGKDYVDVTPFDDLRDKNYFIPIKINLYNTFIQSPISINKIEEWETKIMYYVYCYIDPRNDQPFYVGKGKQDRAFTHIKHTKKERKNKNTTRFLNKLEKMINDGVIPKVIFLAQNIQDEKVAYDIEESFIKKYGRVGYEEDGVLLNICEGARPPNHKGKTYQDIYGDKADEQIEKRRKIQIECGGFGPKNHSDETKKKISLKTKGVNNPRYGVKLKDTEIAAKIGEANKGKKHYSRATLLYIEGINQFIYSNDLRVFCRINGYSLGTFQSQLSKNWPMSRKGKNKGLLIRMATETEISSYITGGVKQDIDSDTFKGFSL